MKSNTVAQRLGQGARVRQKQVRLMLRAIGLLSLLACTPVWAGLYQHVEIDLSALVGRDVVLDFSLYDNNGTVGDSWALVDNVRLDDTDDFEDPDHALDSWYSIDPGDPVDAEVTRVVGTLTGMGNGLMKISEGIPNPVIAARDFPTITNSTLSFDVRTNMSSVAGSSGLDEFVVTVYDWTGDGEENYDDIFDAVVVNAGGFTTAPEATVSVVPAPAALLLGLVGFGAGGIGLRRGRSYLV